MNTDDLFKSNHSQLGHIYSACRAVNLVDLRIPSKEMGFLCMAMHRMARFVSEIGHDGSDLHSSITRFLIEMTLYPDVRIALTATYALGDHGPSPALVVEHLCKMVISERRNDDHPIVTSRGIAFRILKRFDTKLAAQYVKSDAFVDYRNIIDHWLRAESTSSAALAEQLRSEAEWIETQG